jgi:hypothetical protein
MTLGGGLVGWLVGINRDSSFSYSLIVWVVYQRCRMMLGRKEGSKKRAKANDVSAMEDLEVYT